MTISRVFVWSSAVLLVLNLAIPARAVIVLSENFNDDSDNDATDAPFVKADANTSPTSFFVDPSGTDDYWGIHDPVGSTGDYDEGATVPDAGQIPAYTFPLGSGNYLVGENLPSHDIAGSGDIPFSLTWNNLNITGLTDLGFYGLFAAQTPANGADYTTGLTGDFVRVFYRINADAGAFTNLLWFSGRNISGNNPLSLDGDFSGGGDAAAGDLSLTAALYSVAIPTNGTTHTTLDLRIEMSTNGNDSPFAFDSIAVQTVPEPAAFLFGGLVCAVVGLTAVGRRFVCQKATTDGE
jgi:hypothetical protein